jgi:predicted HAD superfamily phosphohydrolase YqeG
MIYMAKANRKANNNKENISAVEQAVELMHLERAGKPNRRK